MLKKENKSKIICIIPARGGSKGVPRKNVINVAGKPLIAHSIDHGIKSSYVNRIVVSTDDLEICEVSERYGAEVIKRPKRLSGDKAKSESALIHVLDYLKKNENYSPDLVVFLQATEPIRKPEYIDEAVQKLIENNADSCFSAYLQEKFFAHWIISNDGNPLPMNMELSNRPIRQEFPTEYIENGNIYVFKPSILYENGDRLGGKIVIYPMHVLDSFGIDDLKDIVIVEDILKMRFGIS